MNLSQIFQPGTRWLRASAFSLCLMLLGGCASMGPGRVPSDRFDYNDAIARSAREQMLGNIVRLRYADFPTFLSVSSVITTYTYDRSVGVEGSAGLSGITAVDTVGGSANLGYTERPTISYSPLSGQEFTRRLLTPIPVQAIFALAQAGWAVDLLMLTGIHRINNVENMSFAFVPPPGEIGKPEEQERKDFDRLREFQRVIDLFLKLADADILEVQSPKHEDALPSLVFSRDVPPAYRPLLAEFRTRLDLDLKTRVFRFTVRLTERADDEITIQSRSLMSIMSFLAKGVELPPAHADAGWARPSPAAKWTGKRPAVPLRVRSGTERPDSAFAAIPYHGHWFYIDHSDLLSKRMFAMLQGLFELQAPASAGAGPLLTLPAAP